MIHQGVEMGRPSLLHVYAARTPPKESSLRYAARAYRPCEVKSASEPAFPIRNGQRDACDIPIGMVFREWSELMKQGISRKHFVRSP